MCLSATPCSESNIVCNECRRDLLRAQQARVAAQRLIDAEQRRVARKATRSAELAGIDYSALVTDYFNQSLHIMADNGYKLKSDPLTETQARHIQDTLGGSVTYRQDHDDWQWWSTQADAPLILKNVMPLVNADRLAYLLQRFAELGITLQSIGVTA